MEKPRLCACPCVTSCYLCVSRQKPLISLRSLINKRHFLKGEKKVTVVSCIFWFLLSPFCSQRPCVLPSGRLGVEREMCEWRWGFANHPTGCLIKCKLRRGEKRSSLSFSLQIKCYGATCGDRERHAGAASALSDSSPKSPASSVFASQQAVLGERIKKPAAGKMQKVSLTREKKFKISWENKRLNSTRAKPKRLFSVKEALSG